MATTRKTTTTSTTSNDKMIEKIQEEKKNEANELDALRFENESLKEQFQQMAEKMEQMALMMQQMNMTSQFSSALANSTPKDIEVVSLVSGTLILTTTGKSDGRHYEFAKQFDTVLIPEGDLKLIIKAMPKTTEGGKFFINDNDFVNKNGLSGVYKNIMPQEKIEEFFKKPFNEAMDIYHQANKAQKAILESMIVDKCLKKEFVDGNVLMMLTKETGKDFMNIEPLLKEE